MQHELDIPHIADLLSSMRQRGPEEALWWGGRTITHRELDQLIQGWHARFHDLKIGAGSVVAVMGDYSPQACALILALISAGAVAVPFTAAVHREIPELAAIAGVSHLFWLDRDDGHRMERVAAAAPPPLMNELLARRHPGLVVFTSGSTGKPKGILHDCERVVKKFALKRPAHRTLLFLLMDHFGGFNTLLSVLSYGGVGVVPPERSPEAVARTIAQARVELLPVTPTFLNLLLASGCANEHDLTSVKLVTYGTEVMPEATLKRMAELFPNARLQQTYGLSELGVLRSKSRDSGSLWLKVGGPGFEIRVVDGILHVRSESAMVGYLNAPSPFDADGWLNTGDVVEQEGEYLRILGRKSDLINVGGQKVLPVEVESALLDADNVLDAVVFGEKHPLMGQVVVARVTLGSAEDPAALKARLRKHCLARMAPFKVPIRFIVAADGERHTARFKKSRRPDQQGDPR
jgi:long-chain acyl-CoA synthetase